MSDLTEAVKTCLPENRLDLSYHDEISCQVLSQYKAKGLSPECLVLLQKSLPIVYPWDCSYNTLRLNYNRRFSYFPMGIIMCRNSKDVKLAMKLINKYDFKFAVRSGGHCYLPFSLSTQLIIDLSRMNKIEVICNDETKAWSNKIRGDKHIILGPGAHLGTVIQKISKFNLALPTGSCVNTGVGGLSLGGGLSPSLIRLGGLMSDHIISIKIVLANGKLIKASRKNNQDLFFAIQGAGAGNFGIITEFIFCPLRFNGATLFKIEYKWSEAFEILKLWQNFAPRTDRRLSGEINLFSPKFVEMPVIYEGQYEGPENKLRKLIKKFLVIGEQTQAKIFVHHVIKYSDVGLFWGSTVQSYFNNNSIFFYKELLDEAINLIIEELEDAPGPLSSVEFMAMMGAVSDVKSDETAFPHRKALFWSQLRGPTLNPEKLPAEQLWSNNLFDKLSNYAKKIAGVVPCYVNVPQKNLEKDKKYLKAYYAENVDKLISIKKKYDPENVFHFPQSIPIKL